MAQMLDFDDSTARQIERIYLTPDVAGQRSEVMRMLAPRIGERIVDVGSGPGLLLADIAASVTNSGGAIGIDKSGPMNAMARARLEAMPWAEVHEASATALPLEDESCDAAVSTQVYEYVEDMPAAMSELARVLRPGGRVVVLDTDWDSWVCATEDRGRMQRVLDAWEAHLHDPHLPTSLPRLFRDAGFQLEQCSVIPLLNTERHPHCYSTGIQQAIHAFVSAHPDVGAEEADAWLAELRSQNDRGDYFFSLNRYLFVAHRAG